MPDQDNKQIKDLRAHLFKQLERLNDPDCDLDKEVKRANALVSVGTTIVSSAKVEVDFIRATHTKGTGFIPPDKQLGNGSDTSSNTDGQ